jgi:hypothetical protein
MDKAAICTAMKMRAEAYDTAAAEWCRGSFEPIASRCFVAAVSREAVIEQIHSVSTTDGDQLLLYSQCLVYNPLRPRPT